MKDMARSLRRITYCVVGASVLLALAALVFGGAWCGLGAAVGALVAILNWYGMRWIGERIMRSTEQGKMIWGTLLALKMAAILGIVWVILSSGWVDPFGFAIGMSGLVLGVLIGGFHLAQTGDDSTGDSAGEES